MHQIGMFGRKRAFTLEGFEGSGADFYQELRPFILDGKPFVSSPHKIYGP
jgi:hypothetical protein